MPGTDPETGPRDTLVSSQQASTLPQKVFVEFGMKPLGYLSKRKPNVRMVQQGKRILSGRELLTRHEKRPLVDIIYVYSEPRQGRLLVLTTLLLYALPNTCPGTSSLKFCRH